MRYKLASSGRSDNDLWSADRGAAVWQPKGVWVEFVKRRGERT